MHYIDLYKKEKKNWENSTYWLFNVAAFSTSLWNYFYTLHYILKPSVLPFYKNDFFHYQFNVLDFIVSFYF